MKEIFKIIKDKNDVYVIKNNNTKEVAEMSIDLHHKSYMDKTEDPDAIASLDAYRISLDWIMQDSWEYLIWWLDITGAQLVNAAHQLFTLENNEWTGNLNEVGISQLLYKYINKAYPDIISRETVIYWIHTLTVDENHRRKNIGSNIVKQFTESLINKKEPYIILAYPHPIRQQHIKDDDEYNKLHEGIVTFWQKQGFTPLSKKMKNPIFIHWPTTKYDDKLFQKLKYV